MNFDFAKFYSDWAVILPECFLFFWGVLIIAWATGKRDENPGRHLHAEPAFDVGGGFG